MCWKYTIFLPVLFCCCFCGCAAFAQDGWAAVGTRKPIVLNLSEPKHTGNEVEIAYSLNYPGYLEFHLFDEAGERIFLTSMVRDSGNHSIKLKSHMLDSNTEYPFYFVYKGKQYSGVID